MSKPTYAHFPGGGNGNSYCASCRHLCRWQGVKKDGQGGLIPVGLPVHWCGKCAEFVGVRPRPDGKKPNGIGEVSPHTSACKYFTRGDADAS